MKDIVVNILVLLLSLLLTLLIAEIGARVYEGEYGFHNFIGLKRDLFRSAYPAEFDKELGWIPKEGDYQRNVWNTRVTILKDGVRSNGNNKQIESGEIILAVGDSFTFGDQVSDDETWPARLEKLSNTRVINGGVFGYGVDQSYLRMQALAAKYKPNIIIFSLIPDDIYRCSLSGRTSVPKPYFELSENDDLLLMNGHLQSYIPPENSLGILRGVLGYSYLAHELMSRTFPEYWLQGSWRSTRVHSKGAEITCRIFERLNHYAQEEKVKLYILAQYYRNEFEFEKDLGILDEVIACIDQDVLELIDMRTSLAELKEQDIDRYEDLFQAHMTREGNYFVASILWDAITKWKGMPGNAIQPTN
jgi:hypothetical protein